MRFIQGLMFLLFLGCLLFFAVQNMDVISVRFWTWQVTAPIAFLAITTYALGMLSGWTIVAFMQRSFRRVTEQPIK